MSNINKKGNFLMEQLYNMAETKDEQGMSVMDENKLNRELDGNKQLMARNKDTFAAGEPKFHTCKWYDPCPICEKCKNKASHLYVRCQTCLIPNCVHSFKDINIMIKRKNFIFEIKDLEFKKAFRSLKRKENENEK